MYSKSFLSSHSDTVITYAGETDLGSINQLTIDIEWDQYTSASSDSYHLHKVNC